MSSLLLERSNELREPTILTHLHKSFDICDETSKNVESVVIESSNKEQSFLRYEFE